VVQQAELDEVDSQRWRPALDEVSCVRDFEAWSLKDSATSLVGVQLELETNPITPIELS
jgi:hypothetical protein